MLKYIRVIIFLNIFLKEREILIFANTAFV